MPRIITNLWSDTEAGLSWQVCPDELGALMADPDPERAERAFGAMLSMTKIDIAAIRNAADGADISNPTPS